MKALILAAKFTLDEGQVVLIVATEFTFSLTTRFTLEGVKGLVL